MTVNQDDMLEFHWLMDMLETVEVGLIVLDSEFRVHVWNGFMENHSGVTASRIKERDLFAFFPDLPETWLRRKVKSVRMLKTRAFTTWEQRPYLFHFRNTRPITGTAPYMYQNLTISPLTSTDGEVRMVCLMVYDVTDVAAGNMALEQANEQLLRLSETDRLTGLLNRGTWENLLKADYERCRRYGSDSVLVMFDIDHFKAVNDTHGHVAGDDVIRRTSEVLLSNLRHADLAGRYGGEEFAIVLPETTVSGAVAMCERIRKVIAATPVDTGTAQINYTISLGVAPMSKDIETPTQWIERADAALYQAKEGGRNQTCVTDVPSRAQ
ncbi:diguanylate cyclase [Marinobacter halodurans]|uniref:diguanylate cyclase n=1 Tax=Marinobacter halodurans TaxID=2528979 RepID=A0ABY1ZLB8_9GAMM|nr:sensor domain-containing diguanylate cyclase [Marinobacter halodurans]TBW56621.1 diguanylate cyclase [Marinobacter halodurans]